MVLDNQDQEIAFKKTHAITISMSLMALNQYRGYLQLPEKHLIKEIKRKFPDIGELFANDIRDFWDSL